MKFHRSKCRLVNDTKNETKEHISDEAFPVAAILCLAIVLYLVLILIGLFLRKCLISRGLCSECSPKLETSESCCSCARQCNWKLPTVDSCLDAICPAKQRINCIEFLVWDWASVQCCSGGGTYTCGSGDLSCTCEAPQCDSINCLCCEISFRSVSTSP